MSSAGERPLAVVNNYADHYRRGLFTLLGRRQRARFLLFGGRHRNERRLSEQVEVLQAPVTVLRQREVHAAVRHGGYRAVVASTNGRLALPAAYLAARRAGIPFVLWATMWHEPETLAHVLARPLMRSLYARADAVVTYGPHVSGLVAGFRDRATIFEAPQATDNARFGREPTRAERAAVQARVTGPFALYCGRLDEEKGLGVLAEAWPRIREAHPGAGLVIAGSGPLASRLSPLEGVVLLGRLEPDELVPWYAEARVAIVPSVRARSFLEPWGFVCNEALLQATPVVASDAVGAAAGGLVADGQTGLVVPAGQARPLAQAVSSILADPHLSNRLGVEGRQRVLHSYTHDAQVAGFEAALAAVGAVLPASSRRPLP